MGFWLGKAQAAIDLGLPIFQGQASYPTFNAYFTALVNFAIIIAGLIAVLMIVYAGIMYSQSQGQADKASQAKELIAGALTGLGLLLMIRFILPTLNIGADKAPGATRFIQKAFAQATPNPNVDTLGPVDLKNTGLAGPDAWASVWGRGINFLLAIAALATFSGIIYSGYMMITAGGDASQMAKAKNNLVWSLIGLVVAMLALVIVRFVIGLGSSLT